VVFERLRRRPAGEHVFLYAFDLLQNEGRMPPEVALGLDAYFSGEDEEATQAAEQRYTTRRTTMRLMRRPSASCA
jgi:hypothetical protein